MGKGWGWDPIVVVVVKENKSTTTLALVQLLDF
jgi:hypothetical protein